MTTDSPLPWTSTLPWKARLSSGIALAMSVLAWFPRGAAPQATPSPSPANSVDLVLRPVRDSEGAVTTVEVTLRFADTASAQGFELEAPVTLYSFSGIAERLGEILLSDPSGPVEVTVSDEGTTRHWRPARSVSWPITARYRAIVPPSRLAAGPPIDLRTYAGGVTFGGSGLLALPGDNRPYRVRLHWDFSTLGAGAIGVCSLGEGDLDLIAPLRSLLRSFYLVGPLERYPERGDVSGFSAFWLGEKDDVDMRGEMAWAAGAYAKLKAFFGDTTSHPYRFFTRVLPEAATSGGTSSINSFMLQVPKPTARDSADGEHTLPRGTMIHEMIHGWVGGISDRGTTQWFGEGLTTYYTTMTGLRLGLVPVEATARDLTGLSRDYYPNPYRNVSADSAAGVFWLSKAGERIPYAKGALYFMGLNARIKEASGGRRSLDDVMFSLFAQREREGSLSTADFLNAMEEELGPGVAPEFDSLVVRGTKTLVVPADALGPCFERQQSTVFVPDFGFRRNEGARRIVTGLRGESAAFQAGLRDGDEVMNEVDPSELDAPTSEPVVLEVQRGEESLTIRYIPRPLHVDSYEWTRVPGVPEEVCRQG